MAGERLAPAAEMTATAEKKPGRIKRTIYWIGEKSPYVTIPLAAVVFVHGARTGSVPLMAGAAVAVGIDVVQNRVFKRLREKEGKSSGEVRAESKGRVIDILSFSRRRRPAQLQAA